MSILSPDSEFMIAVSKIADYIMVNLLCVLFSIPIVTAGAAMSAKFYVAMKLERGEEPQVCKAFFKAFRQNFKQATLIWVVVLAISAVIAWDWYSILFAESQGMFTAGKIIFLVMTILWCSVVYNIFPLIARFRMTTKEAVKGALVFSFLNIHKMVPILFVTAVSYVIEAWYMNWALAIWLLCSTVTLYYVARMYVAEYRKIEEKQTAI